MRISSKSRYATIALMDIAARDGNTPVTLADISRNQDISVSYLEQIFAKLRRTGLVIAARGPGGGYKLSRPADAITVAEIIDTFNGSEEEVEEREAGAEEAPITPGVTEEEKKSTAKDMWRMLSHELHDYLSGVTLAHFVKHPSMISPHSTSHHTSAH